MPHLSELHGAATHLAVVAVPVYVLVLLAGATGLLVRGRAQTMLRGGEASVSTPR